MIASSDSRNSSKNMPRFSLNDIVHNHYLEEAKKKTQERGRNSRPSVMPSAKSQSTTNGSKPKPRNNTQTSRNWPASKKVLWKPTGKIFKTVGLRWIPTRKIFTSSTTKVDSEPTNGSNDDITNQYECKQTLDVSAASYLRNQGFKEFSFDGQVMTSDHNSSELGIYDHNNEPSSSKLVPKVVPPADKTATSRQELELLFHHHITMLSTVAILMLPRLEDPTNTLSWTSPIKSWKPCQGDSLNLPDHRHKIARRQRRSRWKDKDLKTSYIKTKSKDNVKGSRLKIAKHEGTSLQRRQTQRSQELNDKSNLIDLTKECHNELTSGEIVSLQILSRTRKFVH
ncbi:hypothetical protein Tco_0471391 [Tanacetum coccineum]